MHYVNIPRWQLAVGSTPSLAVEMEFKAVLNDLPMSHSALAEKLDIAQSTVSRWARGKTSPSLEQMVRTIDAVKDRLEELSERTDKAGRVIEAVQSATDAKTDEEQRAKVSELVKELGETFNQAIEQIEEWGMTATDILIPIEKQR